MSLTVAQVYSARFGTKLPLPRSVQDNIAKLRITPVAYKPFRPPPKHNSYRPRVEQPKPVPENWREKVLVKYVSRLKDKGDPDYLEVFAILNKISASTLKNLSEQAIEIIKKRDQEFRLRVSTLLFDKAISEQMFAGLLADCAVLLNNAFPEMSEDFVSQAKMFTKLYDINTTLVYPASTEPDFADKVVHWMTQKNKRRCYAKFLTQLFVRNLITEDIMITSIQDVIVELEVTARQEKCEQTEENTTQYVDFLYESSKVLPKTAKDLKQLISTTITPILAIPRAEVPNLCMRSRFRLEDTLKCVQ
jgi:hypothetical protein